jgi:hypothetical protein
MIPINWFNTLIGDVARQSPDSRSDELINRAGLNLLNGHPVCTHFQAPYSVETLPRSAIAPTATRELRAIPTVVSVATVADEYSVAAFAGVAGTAETLGFVSVATQTKGVKIHPSTRGQFSGDANVPAVTPRMTRCRRYQVCLAVELATDRRDRIMRELLDIANYTEMVFSVLLVRREPRRFGGHRSRPQPRRQSGVVAQSHRCRRASGFRTGSRCWSCAVTLR